ncbi:hypothetical protein [Agrococcus sp. HG114]|uniref:hypothetical protein n=1 Tax=Agrococcus sp. HG114 TaxID=2969757 RepID=UPI00215A9581|nr:hypothetical protein [Agrococcus sp. HG114]MCR8670078.1 hypothetical protein [Agrococcus sp. HG114]
MRDVVRLEGDDRVIASLADAARRAVARADARSWLTELGSIGTLRRTVMHQMVQGSAPAAAPVKEEREPASGARSGGPWWTALVLGAAAALVGAAALLPPRRSQVVELDFVMGFAPVALAAGATALAALAILPVPSAPRRTAYAAGLAAMTSVLAVAAVVVSAFRVDDMVAASSVASTTTWFAAAAVAVLASLVIALRARPRRGATSTAPGWRDGAREAKRRALALERGIPADRAAEVGSRWAAELERLAPELPPEARSQAAELGPWRWLVWAYYDGETELPHPLARA